MRARVSGPSLAAAWRTIEEFRQRNGPGSILWSYEVNNRGGAMIALLLRPTSVTPNWVTLSGLVVHVLGSLYVALLIPPVSVVAILPALVGWQLAYCLDCADGLLARETGQTSPFGAWLDQIADAVGHVSVLVALTLYVIRANDLTAEQAVLLLGAIVGANLTVLFAWTLRLMLLGQPESHFNLGGGRPTGAGWLLLAFGQSTDYGGFLFLSSLLLLVPRVLVVYLVAIGVLWSLTVVIPVVRLWPRSRDL